GVLHFGMDFGNGHLQGRVGHMEWRKIEPMRGTSKPSLFGEPRVKRSGGKRCDLSEDGQSGGPLANLAQGAFGDAGGIVVQAKDERGNGINMAASQSLEDGAILVGLIETLVDVGQVGR